MNFAQLKNLCVYWLDDLNFGYFTETQVGIWINNAQREVQKRLIMKGQNYYLTCAQTSLVVNQNEYVLPSNFKKVNSLYIVLSGTPPNETYSPLDNITWNQKYLLNYQTGTPSAYDLKRNRIVMWPYPNAALTLRLDYTYLVADMVNDTDVPDVPEAYQELIALLAAEDGFLKDGRSSEILEKKLKAYEADMDSDSNERKIDKPRDIVTTEFGLNSSGYNFW